MDKKLHQVADLLLAIEAELRRLQLWEVIPPSSQAMASLMPFCHDTLEFHQWLQWMFLPQMKTLLEADGIMPNQCEITPLAEYHFQHLSVNATALLDLLQTMDHLLSAQS